MSVVFFTACSSWHNKYNDLSTVHLFWRWERISVFTNRKLNIYRGFYNMQMEKTLYTILKITSLFCWDSFHKYVSRTVQLGVPSDVSPELFSWGCLQTSVPWTVQLGVPSDVCLLNCSAGGAFAVCLLNFSTGGAFTRLCPELFSWGCLHTCLLNCSAGGAFKVCLLNCSARGAFRCLSPKLFSWGCLHTCLLNCSAGGAFTVCLLNSSVGVPSDGCVLNCSAGGAFTRLSPKLFSWGVPSHVCLLNCSAGAAFTVCLLNFTYLSTELLVAWNNVWDHKYLL
jgi:hypothetical protein